MDDAGLSVKVYGVVQGVGFRYFAQREARRLRVNGFVRNLPDGTVEALGVGRQENLEAWLELLRQGPAASVVSNVQFRWVEPPNQFVDFRIEF